MSIENAEKLLVKVSNDPSLGQKLKAAGDAGFPEFSKSAGLECTMDEFVQAAKIKAKKQLEDKLVGVQPLSNIGVGNVSVI